MCDGAFTASSRHWDKADRVFEMQQEIMAGVPCNDRLIARLHAKYDYPDGCDRKYRPEIHHRWPREVGEHCEVVGPRIAKEMVGAAVSKWIERYID